MIKRNTSSLLTDLQTMNEEDTIAFYVLMLKRREKERVDWEAINKVIIGRFSIPILMRIKDRAWRKFKRDTNCSTGDKKMDTIY